MQADEHPRKELTSWKEIGDFLGVSARTAQKWERERGLPVRRLPGLKGRVSTDLEELEAWKEKNLRRPPWYSNLIFFRCYAAIISALLILAIGVILGGYLSRSRLGPPETHRLDHKTLIVMDAAGREIWRRVFKEPFFMHDYREEEVEPTRMVSFGDIDGDGRIETLFVYRPVTHENFGSELFCFSDKGEQKWKFTPNASTSDETETYTPYFVIKNFVVADLKHTGAKQILVTSHHESGDPNRFIVLDKKGSLQEEYWHSGHLPYLVTGDLDGDGVDEVYLGGVNNGHQAATVVVLQPGHVTGASTQEPGDKSQLPGFVKGNERAVVLFPRSCIGRRSKYNAVNVLSVAARTLKVVVSERINDAGREVIYYLAYDKGSLNVVSHTYADLLADLHNELEARGELDHHLSTEEIDQLKHNVIIRQRGTQTP